MYNWNKVRKQNIQLRKVAEIEIYTIQNTYLYHIFTSYYSQQIKIYKIPET